MTASSAATTRWSHRRAMPWVHAVAAAVAGAVLGQAAQAAAVFLLFGSVIVAPVLLAAAALTFGAIGVVATEDRRGWRFAWTTLVWAPAAVVGFVLASGHHGGEVSPDTWSWWIAAVCGGACAASTLLGHGGRPRLIGIVVVLGATVVLTVAWQREHDAAAIREGQGQLGSTLHPDVIDVRGYRQSADPTIAGDGSDALVTPFIRDGRDLAARDFDLAVVTARARTPVCGSDLLRTGEASAPEPQRSCRRVGDGWERTSAHGVEVARLVDGHTVRVLAPAGTPLALLHRAAASVRPMEDRFYRHALLGEQGQYVRELDGNG